MLRYPGARGDPTGETPTHGTCGSTGLGRCSGRGCTAAPSEGQPGAAALAYLGTSSCREQPGDPTRYSSLATTRLPNPEGDFLEPDGARGADGLPRVLRFGSRPPSPVPAVLGKTVSKSKGINLTGRKSRYATKQRCYGPRSTATGRKELKEINLFCLAHLGLPPALLSTLRGGRGGAAPTHGTPDSVPSSTTEARCGRKEEEVPGGVMCFREAAALHPAPSLPCGQQPPAPAPRVAGICNRPAGEPDPQQRPGNHLKHEDKSSSRSVNKLVPTTLYNLTRMHKEWEGGGRRVPVAASAWRCRSTSRWWR